MSVIEALILGVIQGITEFLPISSSGHIELVKYFLKVETKDNLLFTVVVHSATSLSTIVVFRSQIIKLCSGFIKFKNNEETQFIIKVLTSMIPITIIGLLFEQQLEILFEKKIILVAIMLMLTGVLLLISDLSKYQKNKKISFTHSFIIGIAQAIAIIPGISRSGATISTALMIGVDRKITANFSFLMVIPPIIGATFLKILKITKSPEEYSNINLIPLYLGFFSAFIVGFFACKWMIKLIKNKKLIYFAYYCIIISCITILSFIFK